MGYNRSGTRRKQRLNRHKKETARLIRKAAQQSQGQTPATAASQK